MRFVLGGAVILLWALATGRLRGLRIEPAEWRPLVTLGLTFTVQIVTMNVGTTLTSASHATVLLNVYAVHVVVLSHFMIPGDRLSLRRAAGVLLGYAGIVLLFVRQAAAGTPTLMGDVLISLSAIVLAERTVFMARAVQHLDPVKLLLAQAVIGSACFVVISVVFESRPTSWTPRLAGALAYQGALISGFNFITNLWLLRHYRPGTLATYFLTQPILGVIAASLITGDPLTTDLLVASLCVAAGIGLASR